MLVITILCESFEPLALVGNSPKILPLSSMASAYICVHVIISYDIFTSADVSIPINVGRV